MPTPMNVVIDPCVRCRLEQVEQATGVVAVGMGQPDPADVGRVEHLGQPGDEVAVGQPEAGVDDDRLLGVQHEGVDGQLRRGRGSRPRPCRTVTSVPMR